MTLAIMTVSKETLRIATSSIMILSIEMLITMLLSITVKMRNAE